LTANKLRAGDIVCESGRQLYVIQKVFVGGSRVEVITHLGFPVDFSADDLVVVLRK
jgi:hypothetical protein